MATTLTLYAFDEKGCPICSAGKLHTVDIEKTVCLRLHLKLFPEVRQETHLSRYFTAEHHKEPHSRFLIPDPALNCA